MWRAQTQRLERGYAMEAELSITSTQRAGCHVLVLEGDLDMAVAGDLDAALDACADGRPVVVDLTSLGFVDSSGLHVLLSDRRGGRPVVLARTPGSNVARVLELIDAAKFVRVCDDVAEALDELGSADGRPKGL